MKKLLFPFICILAFTITSCSGIRIEKRHYSGGFYVETGTKNRSNAEQIETESVAIKQNNAEPNSALRVTKSLESPCVAKSENSAPSQESEKNSVAKVIIDKIKSTTPAGKTETNISTAEENKVVTTEQENSSAPASDVPLWVYVLLALFIPPLAVYLKQGVTNMFWIDLILFILGYGLFRFSYYLWGAALAAVVIALLVIFDVL
ncbi:MAG: hypothetical protein RL007_35 [Bacteroidota bacterium]|jgi:uncharacterized membrane protein YqaE (UPF0057 family)